MSRCGSTGQRWQRGEDSRAIQRGTSWAESVTPGRERRQQSAGSGRDGHNTAGRAIRDGQARWLVAMRDGQGVDQRGKARWRTEPVRAQGCAEGQGAEPDRTGQGDGGTARSGLRAEARWTSQIGRPHADATTTHRSSCRLPRRDRAVTTTATQPR